MKLSRSQKTYILLVLLLAISSSINVFLPQGALFGQYELPASKPIIAIAAFFIVGITYGGLGLLGLYLSNKLGVFSSSWDTFLDLSNTHPNARDSEMYPERHEILPEGL